MGRLEFLELRKRGTYNRSVVHGLCPVHTQGQCVKKATTENRVTLVMVPHRGVPLVPCLGTLMKHNFAIRRM